MHVGCFTARRERSPRRSNGSTTSRIWASRRWSSCRSRAFGGERGWGYDGVLPYAPHAAYGAPDDLKRFIAGRARARDDGAARRGLQPLRSGGQLPAALRARILHGPASHAVGRRRSTSRIRSCASSSFTTRSTGSRSIASTACASTPCMRCTTTGPRHFIDELVEAVQEGPGRERSRAHRARESPTTKPTARFARQARDGRTSQWNDDFHHALHVILTGEQDGYYIDYADRPLDHLGRVLAEGFALPGRAFECSAVSVAASRARTCRRPPSSISCRTTIRSAIAHSVNASHASREPDPLRAALRDPAAGAADSDAVHGRGVRRVAAVPVLLRLRGRARRTRSATDVARSSRGFARSPIEHRAQRFPIRMRRLRSSAVGSTGASARASRMHGG